MKRHHRGYTLIELTITMSILISMMAMYKVTYRGFNKLLNNVNVIQCNNSILGFVNTAKQYCREKHSFGEVYFFKDDSSIVLYSNLKKVKEYKLPEGFYFTVINAPGGKINVNRSGQSSDGCTIKYKDRNNNEQVITIFVGTGSLEIK